jgi:hypothetical protein
MDPDREALKPYDLKNACERALAQFDGTHDNNMEHCVVSLRRDAMVGILEAARRDLARLEEKPKRASLGELVEVVKAAANVLRGSQTEFLLEAAAVLRAVGEFKREWEHVSTEEQGDKIAEKLWRSLP